MSEGEKRKSAGFRREADPDSSRHTAAGEKGGSTTLARHGTAHFSAAGAIGGRRVSEDREHMRAIGRIGGSRRNKKNPTVESTLRALAQPDTVKEETGE